ncbi:hypothetical protein J2Y58_002915 [Sphingomonas sp. BE138]|nr:hypothetical protein [Sphingomonas sp. BE138]
MGKLEAVEVTQADRDLRNQIIGLDWPGNHAVYEHELDRIIARHRLTVAAQHRWRAINQPPAEPCNVLLICAPFEWHDQKGNTVPLEPMRDELERMELAFWDGQMWCEAGTGHDIVHEERASHLMPTHWMPLPADPLTLAAEGEEA